MNKQTLTMLIVAAALAALLLILENPFKGERPPRWREEEKVQLFSPVSEEEALRIEISGLGTTTTLLRRDNQWFTHDGYKGDPDAIAQLFWTLSNVGEPQLMSIDPNALLKFRLDPITGTHLRIVDTQGIARVDLFVGELQRDFFYTPVRRPDSPKVYKIRAMLRGFFQRANWRDYNIFRLDAFAIRRVAVQRPNESYAIARETGDSPWHFSEPTSAPTNTQMADGWVQRLARLRASDFQVTTSTDMLTTFGLTAPSARIQISLENGSSYTLAFGSQNPATRMYYAKRPDDPQVYRLHESIYSDVLKKKAELEPKPEVPPPAVTPTSPPLPAAPPGKVRVTSPTRPLATPTTRPTALKERPQRPLTRPSSAPAVVSDKLPKPSTVPTSPPARLKRTPPKAAPRATPPARPTPSREAGRPTTPPLAK